VSFLAALLIGMIYVRFTKTYFIMLTVAFGELIYAIGNKWAGLTGGDDGLTGIPIPTIALPGLPILDLQNFRTYYYFVLFVVACCVLLLWLIVNSRFGYALRAIRDNRERAEFLGINVRRHLLLCNVLSGVFAGIAGFLLIPFEGMVSLDTLHFSRSGNVIMMSILGGTQHFLGPVIGATVFIFIKDTIQNFTEFWMLYMGAIFVATVLFFPGGIGSFFSALHSYRGKSKTPVSDNEGEVS